jgi:hypothetical protein
MAGMGRALLEVGAEDPVAPADGDFAAIKAHILPVAGIDNASGGELDAVTIGGGTTLRSQFEILAPQGGVIAQQAGIAQGCLDLADAPFTDILRHSGGGHHTRQRTAQRRLGDVRRLDASNGLGDILARQRPLVDGQVDDAIVHQQREVVAQAGIVGRKKEALRLGRDANPQRCGSKSGKTQVH